MFHYMYVLQVVKQLYPEFEVFTNENSSRWNMFDKVCGSDFIRIELQKNNYSFDKIKHYWRKDEEDFKKKSTKYWIYKE